MSKSIRGYKLFVVPCCSETEFIAHNFEMTCVENGTIYILTRKKIEGAVRIEYDDKRIGAAAREWLKNNIFDIELKALKNNKKLKYEMRPFIETYKNELEKACAQSEERRADNGNNS